MASHFSTLGMPLAGEEDFAALAQRAGPLAQAIGLANGAYFHWSDASGAELWLQVNDANEFTGMNPHFRGRGRVLTRLVSRVRPENAGPFDGGFYAWADPEADKETQNPDVMGLYPFVFDSPEFARLLPLDLPISVPMQIAAFAHEVETYDSVADFDAAQTGEAKLAAVCFIPSGLFRPDGTAETLPEARAVIAGTVLSSERRTNGLTGREFFAVLVQSHGGTFDCVIDLDLLAEAPRVGGILTGSVWLSGRVVVE